MSNKHKAQLGELLDSLEQRIKTEKSLLHDRLTRTEQTEEQRPIVSSRRRPTGRLYQVFQELSFVENE